MDFFKLSRIDGVILEESEDTNTLTKQILKNVYAVIDFLKTKEKAFSILIFDFYSPSERESSSKNLFKNFLNFFFITKPRFEMSNRYKIFTLTTQISLNTVRYNMLIQLMKLIGMPPEQMSEEYKQIKKRILMIFPNIPLVFDNVQYQIYYNDSIFPDSFFYQLQFIFNEWDSNPTFSIIERLLTARYKITQMKLLRFDIIASSINAKRFNFDEQDDESLLDNQKDDEEEDQKEMDNEEKKSIEIHRKFIERHEQELNKLRKEMIQNQDENANTRLNKESSDFWNPHFDIYSIKDGIIINQKDASNKSKIVFDTIKKTPNKNMQIQEQPNVKKSRKLSKASTQNVIQVQNDEELLKMGIKMLSTHQNIETELYKIFQYNESEKRWIFNSETFDKFAANKRINLENSKIPLVFYPDSEDEDVQKINSNFILGVYPKFSKEDNEQIFVYALCDKSLTMLNIKPDFKDPEKTAIKPIFLILHMPKSKANHPLLPVIIAQIYTFLTSICNVMVVILKDKFVEFQINFLSGIFTSLYDYKILEKEDESKKGLIANALQMFDIISKPKIAKGPNLIFLINNKKVEYNNVSVTLFKNHSIFSPLMANISADYEFHLIQVDKIETYKDFLDSLSNCITTDKNYSTFSKVKTNFYSIHNFEMSNLYIGMKNNVDWKTALSQTILKRYSSLSDQKRNENDVSILSFLYNELSTFSPRVDINFIRVYQNAILEIRKKVSRNNRSSIQEELNKSSELDIECISGRIKTKNFWTLEQLDKIRCIHELFLRKEYFDIVKMFSSDFNFNILFEDNAEILTDQIEKDRKELNKVFTNPLNILKRRETIVQNDIKKESKRGTNYILKETTREISVTIDINQNLTSVIEQDF